MAEDNGDELHEYPGEIQERTGRVPLFLKLTYVGFVLFGIVYFVLYVSGDGSPLVDELNRAMGHGVP